MFSGGFCVSSWVESIYRQAQRSLNAAQHPASAPPPAPTAAPARRPVIRPAARHDSHVGLYEVVALKDLWGHVDRRARALGEALRGEGGGGVQRRVCVCVGEGVCAEEVCVQEGVGRVCVEERGGGEQCQKRASQPE